MSKDRLASTSLVLCLFMLGLAGCQSMAGVSNVAQVRVIDASPDAPMLDIYQGPSALSYNLTFGNITSYVSVPPGVADLSANVSGSHQMVTRTHETLASGQYTLLVGNTSTDLQQLLLKDQNIPAAPGQTALRFVTQVTAMAAFDVYLVPPGAPVTSIAPILTNQSFGSNSGYLNIPAGSYRIVLYSAGTSTSVALPATYSGVMVSYPSGAVRTIILLDQKAPLRPPVQVVTASDVDTSPRSN